MKKWIASAVKWVWEQIKDEITAPIEELSRKIDAQDVKIDRLREKMEAAHQYDPAARECDLASLDDQICQQIERCRQRGYTTAEDRRRVGRMHRAYHARGAMMERQRNMRSSAASRPRKPGRRSMERRRLCNVHVALKFARKT